MHELLEPRRLFAATLTSARLDVDAGKVVLVGSPSADLIEVRLFGKDQAQIVDGGDVALTFDIAAAPKGISFFGGDGSDYLSMGRTPLRLWADGGNDADGISGSRGGLFANTLFGGSANDYLFGGTGPDTLDGGGGDDTMLGYDGNDTFRVLSDSFGDDTVIGGLGDNDAIDCTNYNRGVRLRIGDEDPNVFQVDDRVWGGIEAVLGTGFSDNIVNTREGKLTVYLGRGYDIFTGNNSNELVYGGRGNDTINTGGGNDVIFDYEGDNVFDGGDGLDSAFVAAEEQNNLPNIEGYNIFDGDTTPPKSFTNSN